MVVLLVVEGEVEGVCVCVQMTPMDQLGIGNETKTKHLANVVRKKKIKGSERLKPIPSHTSINRPRAA